MYSSRTSPPQILVAETLAILAAACSSEAPRRPVDGEQATRSFALQDRVLARLDSLDATSSTYARDLATGREVAVRADTPMNTVSVIKIPIMILAYRDAEAGRLDLNDRYSLRAEDLRGGTGLLKTFALGLAPTYRDLIGQMIITSDNTATDVMIARLGLGRVNQMLDSLGYRETRLRMTIGQLVRGLWVTVDPEAKRWTDRELYDRGFPNGWRRAFAYLEDSTKWFGRTTAREMARLLEQLESGKLASPESTKEMREALQRQFYSSRLPQRIRFRVATGHKTGDWTPIIGNDVGIIYPESGPIVIAVFTNANHGDFVELEATIGRVAEDILVAWGS